MVVTNMLGIAFTATLLSASDAGVTFVFPEDGATNTLAWTQLSASSQDAVCAAADFAPVPPGLAATFRLVWNDLRRLEVLAEDRKLTPEEATQQCDAAKQAFRKRCLKKGLSPQRTELLMRRF